MPTSEELLELAGRCAEKLDLDGKLRHVPAFSDAEDGRRLRLRRES